MKEWVPEIVRSNAKAPLEEQKLIPALKKAIITLDGKLTPNFEYIQALREKHNPALKSMIKKE